VDDYICVWQVKFADSKYAIRLPDVNLYDSGRYMCIVTNDYGQLNWTVKLDVYGNDILFYLVHKRAYSDAFEVLWDSWVFEWKNLEKWWIFYSVTTDTQEAYFL